MIEDPIARGLEKGWRVTDCSTLTQDLTLETEVVIVGSGAGGGLTAEILSQAGFKVLVVEEGPLKSSQDFRMLESEAYPDLYQESAARKTADKAINILQGKCVGGGTTVNWTSSFETPSPTLNHWTKHFQVEQCQPEAMQPFFEKVFQRLNINRWEIPPNANNQALADGLAALGHRFETMSRNVKHCANLGYCGVGCPINAKQSMLVTTIPKALESGAQLFTRARAETLTFRGDQVTGLKVHALDSRGVRETGCKIAIRAQHVVLAAGAIGSPALLMRSKAPDPHGLVGKRTFLHPVNVVAALMNDKINAFSGAPQSIYSDAFLWPEGATGPMGFKLEVPPLHPLLVSTVMDGFAKQHRELMKQLPFMQATIALHRDGFHPESRGGTVTLRADGSPFLDYPLTDFVWQGMRRSYLVMTELLFAAGAKEVLPVHRQVPKPIKQWKEAKTIIETMPLKPLQARLFSAHVMGGCPFGENPEKAVVNSQGQHHHLNNLTIFDGSVFPTSIGSNPQVSIYAFAMKNALAMVERLTGNKA